MRVMEQIASVMGVLLIFVLVLYGSYVCTKKVAKMSSRGNRPRYMKMEDQLMLGQDKFLAIVRLNGTFYLVGVTGDAISLLSVIKREELQELEHQEQGFLPNIVDFRDVLKKLKK